MMTVKHDVTGLTLGYVSRFRGIRQKGYRVFIQQDVADECGKVLATGYDLAQIVRQHPELKKMRIASEEDYYGETIIRLKKGGSP